MKFAIAAALALTFAAPAFAQESTRVPLLRVYIDAPYFYEIMADVADSSDPTAHSMTVYVEGKEVGESQLAYNCETGDYTEEVVGEWTGDAPLFLQPALMAYHHLHC